MKIEVEIDGALLADLEAILRSPYWPSMGEPEAYPLGRCKGALVVPCLMPKEEVLLDDVKTIGDVASQIIRHHLTLYRNARIAIIAEAIRHYDGDAEAVDEGIEDYDALTDKRDIHEIYDEARKALWGV